MKLSLWGGLAKVAAGGLASVYLGPIAGVALVAAFAGGDAGKALGAKLGKLLGRQLEHLTGPAGALGGSAIALPTADALGLDASQLCMTVNAKLGALCAEPQGLALTIAAGAVLLWHGGRNTKKALERPPVEG